MGNYPDDGAPFRGTLEAIISEIRKLGDEFDIVDVLVNYKRPKKPHLTLVTKDIDNDRSNNAMD